MNLTSTLTNVDTQILNYLPLATQTVGAVETALKGQASGQTKLTVALNVIQALAQSSQSVPNANVQAVGSLVGLIDGIVSAFNQTGVFSHSSTPTASSAVTAAVSAATAPVAPAATAVAPATPTNVVTMPVATTTVAPVAPATVATPTSAAATTQAPSVLEQIFHPNVVKALWAQHQPATATPAAPATS